MQGYMYIYVNILPISKKFDLNDLIFFYKIINGYIQIELPFMLTSLMAYQD